MITERRSDPISAAIRRREVRDTRLRVFLVAMTVLTVALVVAVLTQVLAVVDAQEDDAATRASRLADAVAQVDELTRRRAEEQAASTQARYDELIAKITELLQRPAGVQEEPVTAVPAG